MNQELEVNWSILVIPSTTEGEVDDADLLRYMDFNCALNSSLDTVHSCSNSLNLVFGTDRELIDIWYAGKRKDESTEELYIQWISDVIEHLESQEVDILLRVEIEGSDKVDVLRYTDLSVQLTQCRFVLDDDIDLINMGAMLKGMDPIPFVDNTFVTLTYESSYSGSYKASSPVLVEGYENTFDVFSLLEQTQRKFKAISKL